MATTQYIGARYVPIFADPAEWSSTKQYEPLTIVLHQGNSFTSKKFVPVGVDINDADYWAETGNYNAQIEQYRRDVLSLNNILPSNEFTQNFTVKDYIDSKANYVTPEMFGAIGDGFVDDYAALQQAMNNPVVLMTKTYRISKEIVIDHPITILSANSTILQSNFYDENSQPQSGIVISSSNVYMLGHLNIELSGNKRQINIEGTGNSGIRLLSDTSINNLKIESVSIINFIGGLTSSSPSITDVNINNIHVEKCDFGIWGANWHDLHVGVLSFYDIDHSQDNTDPTHAIYLTGNTPIIKSTNVLIDLIIGTKCNRRNTDCVASIKGTTNFICRAMIVSDVSQVFTTIYSDGLIENCFASDVHDIAFLIQGESANQKTFNVRNSLFTDIANSSYFYSVGAGANALIENCKFSGTCNNYMVYISATTFFEEKNCIFVNTGDSTIPCYGVRSTNVVSIINPTIQNASLVTYLYSGVYVKFYLNPENYDVTLCNTSLYSFEILENDKFVKTNDANNMWVANNLIAGNTTITRLHAKNKVTVINDPNNRCAIVAGTYMKLKNNSSGYSATEWDAMTFVVYNDVAYEV